MEAFGDAANKQIALVHIMMTGMVCIGLVQGIQPLLGYCAGAGKWDRYDSIRLWSIICPPAADILSLLLAGILYRRKVRKMIRS